MSRRGNAWWPGLVVARSPDRAVSPDRRSRHDTAISDDQTLKLAQIESGTGTGTGTAKSKSKSKSKSRSRSRSRSKSRNVGKVPGNTPYAPRPTPYAPRPMPSDTVLVIGSNCFTGSHVVDALLAQDAGRVIGVSRSPEYAPLFLPYKSRGSVPFEFHQIDIVKDFEDLHSLLQRVRPRVVINVAALSEVGLSNESPIEYFQINTVAVARLCDFLRRQGWLEQYVHISSAEILGSCSEPVTEEALFNPSTPYAVSKAAADMFLNTLASNFGFPATLVRSTNVYGPHQQLFKIIPRTVIYLKLGRAIELHGGGESVKSFIHVRDVVDGLVRAIETGRTGTYHFSVPSDHTVAEIVRTICRKMGRDFDACVRTVGQRLGQDSRYWLDCTKARRDLGWSPRIDLEEGLSQVISWVEEHWSRIRHEPLEYVHRV